MFVTENPSIVSAASDLATRDRGIRVLCTSGTPSVGEIGAIGRLARAGWQIAVRADFDAAGIRHVGAVMKAVPHAVPWRMGINDYVDSLQSPATSEGTTEAIPDAPWDLELSALMRQKGVAYEESLLPALLEDLRRGTPR